MKRTGLRKLANGVAEWEQLDRLVYYWEKLYVPNNVKIRHKILKQCHDSVTTKYPDYNLTLELVERHYWWLLIRAFVDEYIRGCEQCQCFKPIPHPKLAMLPITIPEGLWQIISTDLVTRLPLSKGINSNMYTAIAIYVDLYIKQAHFALTTDKVNPDGIADLYIHNVFRLHGLPQGIISD